MELQEFKKLLGIKVYFMQQDNISTGVITEVRPTIMLDECGEEKRICSGDVPYARLFSYKTRIEKIEVTITIVTNKSINGPHSITGTVKDGVVRLQQQTAYFSTAELCNALIKYIK